MRYAKYKPTGIAWLPEVPEGWNVRKLTDVALSLHTGLNPRKFFELNPDGAENYYVTIREISDGKIVFTKNTARINDEALRLCNNRSCLELGDVLFSGTGTIGEIALLKETPRNWNIKEGIYTIKPNQKLIAPQMLCYVVSSHYFLSIARAKAVGTGVKSVPMKELLNIQLILPPLPTQRAIVAFLDEKCGKVDRLVAVKEKEVALLKELKQSVIAEAVTRGVGEKVEKVGGGGQRRFKPSGIPWLPEVPEGWEMKKVRQIARESKTKNKGNVETNVLSLSYGRIIRKKDVYSGLVPTDFATYQIVEPNYVVLRLTDLQNDHRSLRCGLVKERGIITSAYVSIVPQNILPAYLYLALHTCDLHKLFYSMGGGLRQSMNFADVANIFIPVPPLAEQREIVGYIEAKAAKIDAAVAGLEKEIAALKEYKQRLIADVVTGQRKVA